MRALDKVYPIAQKDMKAKKRPYTKRRWWVSKKDRYIPEVGDRFDAYVVTRIERDEGLKVFGYDAHAKEQKCIAKRGDYIESKGRIFHFDSFYFVKVA